VLSALKSAGKAEELAALARQLARHVAAANPQALDPAGLDAELVKREKNILADKYRQQGKPENVIEKIVTGRLNGFYKDYCLLEQGFVKEPKSTIATLLGGLGGYAFGPAALGLGAMPAEQRRAEWLRELVARFGPEAGVVGAALVAGRGDDRFA